MVRFLGFILLAALPFNSTGAAEPKGPSTVEKGIRPVGTDGKPLNLDFETGTLKDWTAEGEAFRGQPIKGDTDRPATRRHEEPTPGRLLDRQL